MPVDFLSDEQAARYGRYNQEPDEAQLFRYFHLDDEDKREIALHRGDHNRLGFALQLCTVRFHGTFLEDPAAVPAAAVRYIAAQIGVSDLACLERYHVPATRYLHTEEIRGRYGYRDFSTAGIRLTRWLYERAWIAFERPSVLFDLTTAWLAERKILLPDVTTLTRLIARSETGFPNGSGTAWSDWYLPSKRISSTPCWSFPRARVSVPWSDYIMDRPASVRRRWWMRCNVCTRSAPSPFQRVTPLRCFIDIDMFRANLRETLHYHEMTDCGYFARFTPIPAGSAHLNLGEIAHLHRV